MIKLSKEARNHLLAVAMEIQQTKPVSYDVVYRYLLESLNILEVGMRLRAMGYSDSPPVEFLHRVVKLMTSEKETEG